MSETRRPNDFLQEHFSLDCDHASTAASLTVKAAKLGRAFRIDRVTYINPTGLAEDTANNFKGELKIGSTLVSQLFYTDSDEAGPNSLTADTFITGTLSAVAGALNGAAEDTISLVLTKFGTQTLPAGKLRVEGRYL